MRERAKELKAAARALEGVVAKRRSGRYVSGGRGWVKTKNRAYWRYELERESRLEDSPRAPVRVGNRRV